MNEREADPADPAVPDEAVERVDERIRRGIAQAHAGQTTTRSFIEYADDEADDR